MFSIPFMIRSAVDTYGYAEDDVLTDVISSFATFGCAIGEIIGPIFAGTFSDFFGIENCCLLASFVCLVLAVVFVFGTGYAQDVIKGRKYKNESLLSNKISPEDDNLALRE